MSFLPVAVILQKHQGDEMGRRYNMAGSGKDNGPTVQVQVLLRKFALADSTQCIWYGMVSKIFRERSTFDMFFFPLVPGCTKKFSLFHDSVTMTFFSLSFFSGCHLSHFLPSPCRCPDSLHDSVCLGAD